MLIITTSERVLSIMGAVQSQRVCFDCLWAKGEWRTEYERNHQAKPPTVAHPTYKPTARYLKKSHPLTIPSVVLHDEHLSCEPFEKPHEDRLTLSKIPGEKSKAF